MTGKADFTQEEWDLILEGPPSAGIIVATAQRGGTFRESFAIGRAYVEARKQHGDSELLDEIVAAKPERDHTRYHSAEELKQAGLQHPRDARLAEACAEAATDHDRLDVDQVEGRGGARSQGANRPLDQLLGVGVVLVQRVLPDRARQLIVPVLLHQREQPGFHAALLVASCLALHCRASGVGLEAATAPARALGAAELDHHVADLARGAASQPAVLLDHDRAADTGSPPEPEERPERPARAEHGLAFDRRADVVPDPHGHAEAARQRLAEWERVRPVRQIARVGNRARRLVDGARGADADACERGGGASGLLGRLLERLGDRVGNVRGAAVPRRGPTRLTGDGIALVDDDGLDLGAAEVDATSHGGFLAPASPTIQPTAGVETEVEEVLLAATEQPISFAQDIKPLFREGDRESMSAAFDLWSYDDVVQNSDAILGKLRDGTMPCDGAWPEEQVDLFQRWVDAGMPA